MTMNHTLKKVLSALLCLCMLLQNAPIVAFAADGDGLCEHHTEHTPECHYAEAAPGSDCHYQCAECAAASLLSEEAPVCDCGSDDPALHATFCTAYVAPEDPECSCAEKCGVEAQNFWCDVCGFDYAACAGGTDEGVPYADAAEITGVSIRLDGDTTINSGHITVTSENSIFLIVNGTNLENLSEEYYFDIPYLPVYMKSAGSLSEDGTIDIYLAPTWLEGLSEYPIVYVTDDGTRVETGIYLTYDDGTGGEEDTTPAEITGVTITVDGVPYTSGNVTITPDTQSIVYTVTGTNFAALSEEHSLLYTYLERSYLTDDVWVVDTAANTATWDLSADIDRFEACDGFRVTYSNYGLTIETRIYLTYVRPTPDSTGKIVVDMKDAFSDSWNNAAIEIYKNGQLAETATVEDGVTYNTVSLDLDSTASYAFKWVKGRFDSECSFTIYIDGEEAVKVSDASVYEDGETILTLGDDTTGGETDPVCTCEVKCSEGNGNTDCDVCSEDISGCVGEGSGPDLGIRYMIAAGNGHANLGNWLNGFGWDLFETSNRMTETSANVYEITYTDLLAHDDYQVMFSPDGTWANTWGGTYVGSGVETDAELSGQSITFAVPIEGSDVTLKMDLTGYDPDTRTGAKFTVTVTPPEAAAVCTCTEKCTEGSVDSECAVCSADLTGCTGEEPAAEATRVIYVDEIYFGGNSYFFDADLTILTVVREELEDGWVKYTVPADAKYYSIRGHVGGGGGGDYPELPTNADTYDPFRMTWSCSHPGYEEGICTLCGEACPGHTGGEATCEKQAVCTICGTSYGEVGSHSYDTSGSCTACGEQAEAKVGETFYMTLAEAAAEVTEGGTIEVLTDVTIGADETVTFAAFATLDVAEGKTVTCDGDVTIGEDAGIIFENELYYYGDWNDDHSKYNGQTYFPAGDGYIIADDGDTGMHVLEMVDATIYDENEAMAIGYGSTGSYSLKILFSGENTIRAAASVSGTSTGIGLDGDDDDANDLILSGGDGAVLNIIAGEAGSYSMGIDAESVTITGGTVNVTSGNAGLQSMAINTSESVTVEEGATLNLTFGEAPFSGGAGVLRNEGTINGLIVVPDDNTLGIAFATSGNTVLVADFASSVVGQDAIPFSVPADTSLTVSEGVTVDLSMLEVDDIDFSGDVYNNGTILLPEGFGIENAPKGGTVTIGDKSYTWNGEKWICGEGSHVFGTDGSCTACGVQAAASVTKSVAGGIVGNGSTTYYETLDAAIQAVSTCTAGDQAEVKLLADIDLGSAIQRITGGVFTLDLNGKTLTGSNHNVLNIDGGTVTIADSAEDGCITCTDDEGATPIALCIDGGTVTVAGGTIRCSKTRVPSNAVQISGGNLTVSGGYIIGEGYRGIAAYGGIVTITGGTITGAYFDICKSSDGTLTLTLADGKTEGATFPGGIRVYGITLGEILGSGMAYWQGDKMIVPADGQIEITGGDVTVREACKHENGTATYTLTADGMQHVMTWSCCGATVTEDHTFTDGACTGCGIIGGYCGASTNEGGEQSLIWTLVDGKLTISGTGAMADCSGSGRSPWWGYKDQITTIVVNEGITTIGKYAFSNLQQVTTAKLPDSLTTISTSAFGGCTALKTVNLPANLKTIEAWAFQGCYALESVTLPEGLTTVDMYAFYECIDLKSVSVPASVTTIGEYAFALSPARITVAEDNPNYSSDEHGVLFDKNKTTLIFCRTNIEAETYTIPSTVTKISESAFFECKDLVTIIIPEGVTTIGESAFSECTALTAITIPAGVTTIEFNTFSGCTSLTTVTILAGVTTIDVWAFSACTALTTVTIPASVTSIHEDAFDNCNALATVNVPCTWDGSLYTFDESVTLNKVHNWVDGTCTLCGEVCDHSGNTNEATNNGNGTHSFACSVCNTAVTEDHTGGTATCTEQAECQHCGAGYGDLDPDNHTYESNVCCGYCGDPYVNGGKDVMWTLTDGKLTITGSGPMAGHGDGTIDPWSDVKDGITSMAIGQGVTTIGYGAFEQFEALTAVELPEGMTTIGGYAFSYCGKLAEITIPSTVTVIDEYAFAYTALTAVEIPAGVTTIGAGAFYHCKKLAEISIPNTVTAMGDYVFNQCKALTGITIPGSVKRIGELTFWNCTALETVTLDNGVETIGDSAFYGCTALKEITIPASVTSIERYAFRDCDALKEITIPASVTSIESYAFSGCDALETANVSCGWAAKPLYTFADTVTVNIDEHTYENGKCSVCGAYDLWVAGEQITDSKLTVNGTTGTATYDPATDTLTLNGFDNGDKCYTFTSNGATVNAAIFTMSDLNIVLVGENSLYVNIDSEGYKTAIQSSGGLTIGGEGSLDAGTDNWCISAVNGMTITGGTLDIYGTTVLDGPTTITGGNVSLNATDCVCYGTLTVNGGKVTVFTGVGYIESFGYPVVIGEGMAAYDKNGHVIENPDFKKLSYAQIKAAHVHSWTYTAEGDTIIATCNAEGCPDPEQSITICADGKTYDGTPVTAELEGSIDGVTTPEIVYSGNTNAGTHTASITIEGKTASVMFTIEKATVTVTADAKTKTYGDADPELTYTVSGLVGEDKLTGALTRAEGENVGSYAITLGTLTAGDNYTVSFTGAEFAIGAKDVDVMTMEVEVTLEQDSYAYDGTAKEPEVTSIIVDGVKLTEDVDYRVLSYERNIYVGEAEVVIHFMGNYRGSLSQFFQITKAPLTVTADSKTMTTGQELPTFTYTITGFVGGESEDVLTAKPTVSCEANGQTAGTYDITVSGAAADNYEITHVNGTLSVIDHQHAWTYTAEGNTITAICGNWATCADPEQTITLTAPESYTYSGEALYSASVDGSIDGVTYTVRYTGTDYSSADAPKDAGSYTVTLTAGGVSASDSFTIRPKSIASCTVSLSQNSFTYNGTAPALTVTVVDNGIGSSALTEDTDYTVGAVQVDAGSHKLTVTGKGNYTGTAQLDYTISKAASAISFTSAYDPSREYTGAALLDPTEPYMSITNAAFADVIITWYRGSVSDANKLPGAPKDAGTYYVVASIPDSGNVTGSSTTSRAIIIRSMVAGTDEVDITLAQEQFTYDGTAKTPAVVSVRYQGFDIPASEFEVSYSGNTNVGTATVTITDKPGGNFTVSGSATFQITKAAAVLTAPTANALTYTGAAQDLIAKGSTDHGTMVYSLTEDGSYSTTIPQGTDAGKYTVYYKVLGDSNHSDTDTKSLEVTIAKAQAVITVDTAPITVTYGDTLTLPTATTNFGTVVCDKTAAELVNAGTYTITYSVEGTANYAGAEKKLTVTVEKKAVAEPTVTGTYTYTGSELTVSLAGVESCMTVASGSKGVGAGSYEVLITLDADHTWADGSDGKIAWTIGKAQAAIDVDTDPITVTYGETLTLPAATSNFGTVVCDKTAEDLKNAGTYTVTYTVPGTENYDGDTKSITVTVEVKTLYVNADHLVKTYSEADPALTYTVEGLVDGDTLTGHPVREAGEDAGSYTISQGTLTASSNYTVSFTNGIFEVQPKSLLDPDITLTVETLVWNGQEQNAPVTLKDGDKVLLPKTEGAAYDYELIGWYSCTNAEVLELELHGAGNYRDKLSLFWEILPVFSAEAPATADGKGKIIMESTLGSDTVLEFASGADFADAADFDASGTQEADPGTYYVRVKANSRWDLPAGTAVQVVVPKSYTGIIQQPQGGNVDIFPEAVVPGEDITVTVTPDKGKVIDDVTITGPDGNEIPVTDNGDGTFTYEQPEGNVSIDVTFAIDTIQIVPQGEDPFQAGQKVEIDGIRVPIDEDGQVWIKYTGSRLMTTYAYAVNDDGKEYPTAMYVWILNWTDEDGDGETDHCVAVPVSELDNFMLYKGTSIRVGHSSNGIRFFTAVPAEALDSLMKGQLLTGELEGYQLVEMGTLYKWASTGTELTIAAPAKSYVYGGSAGNSFRTFSKEGDSNWFTGMLTELPGDAGTLAADIVSRPYAVLENEAGDQLTIYGGSIQRSIYYVATQNADTWAEGSAYDNYVENIISTVDNANG